MLDQRNLPGFASGIILLNLHSDDSLGSIDNSVLRFSFMVDFKAEFDVRIQTISSVASFSGIL